MTEINHVHFDRILANYSGAWAGEIITLWQEYKKLKAAHEKLVAAAMPLLESDGDLKSVHIPHGKFSAFREALPE